MGVSFAGAPSKFSTAISKRLSVTIFLLLVLPVGVWFVCKIISFGTAVAGRISSLRTDITCVILTIVWLIKHNWN